MGKNENRFNIGEVEIPADYFTIDPEQKKKLASKFIDKLLIYITCNYLFKPEVNRVDIMKKVIESSLETNNENENYEVSAFLIDCLKYIDEA